MAVRSANVNVRVEQDIKDQAEAGESIPVDAAFDRILEKLE